MTAPMPSPSLHLHAAPRYNIHAVMNDDRESPSAILTWQSSQRCYRQVSGIHMNNSICTSIVDFIFSGLTLSCSGLYARLFVSVPTSPPLPCIHRTPLDDAYQVTCKPLPSKQMISYNIMSVLVGSDLGEENKCIKTRLPSACQAPGARSNSGS